jgi:hypothetical protein
MLLLVTAEANLGLKRLDERRVLCDEMVAQKTAATIFYGYGLTVMSLLEEWRRTGEMPDLELLRSLSSEIQAKLWTPEVGSRLPSHAQFFGCNSVVNLLCGDTAMARKQADNCYRICSELPQMPRKVQCEAMHGLQWASYVHAELGLVEELQRDVEHVDLASVDFPIWRPVAAGLRSRLEALLSRQVQLVEEDPFAAMAAMRPKLQPPPQPRRDSSFAIATAPNESFSFAFPSLPSPSSSTASSSGSGSPITHMSVSSSSPTTVAAGTPPTMLTPLEPLSVLSSMPLRSSIDDSTLASWVPQSPLLPASPPVALWLD